MIDAWILYCALFAVFVLTVSYVRLLIAYLLKDQEARMERWHASERRDVIDRIDDVELLIKKMAKEGESK